MALKIFRYIFLLVLIITPLGCVKTIKISTIEELQKIGRDPKYPLNGNYELTNDIDATETFYWHKGEGFHPICPNSDTPFIGRFNGNGYKIINLFISYTPIMIDIEENSDDRTTNTTIELESNGSTKENASGNDYDHIDTKLDEVTSEDYNGFKVGLFRYIGEGGEVFNLGLENVIVIGEEYVGGIAGENRGKIRQCYVTGTVIGDEKVGMLVGTNSYKYSEKSNLISQCFAIGDVIGKRLLGGLIGVNNGNLSECYCAVRINHSSDTPFYVYSDEFGMVGAYYHSTSKKTIKPSYWDIDVSGLKDIFNRWKPIYINGHFEETKLYNFETSRSTSHMMMRETYKGWDFEKVWKIEEQKTYPYLRSIKNFKFPLPHIPIEIDNIEDLEKIGRDINFPINGWYVLTKDLDASETKYWNNGEGFNPPSVFYGTFDGCGHTISNLYICRDNMQNIGLFSVSFGRIQNLNMSNVYIVGGWVVGAIAGITLGTIENCSVSGYIEGFTFVGAICGSVQLTSVKNCGANATVVGNQDFVGGITGVCWSGNLSDCYSNCIVKGDAGIGGLIGLNEGSINNGFAEGTVIGNEDVEPLVGLNYIGSGCEHCYSTVNVVYLNEYSDGITILN